MKTMLFIAATSLAAACASAAAAQDRFAVGAQVGTTGVGLEGKFKLTDRFGVRGTLDTLQWEHELDTDDVSYDGDLDFNTAGLFVDFHPTGGPFFISAGSYFGERKVSVDGRPRGGTVELGGQVFTAEQTGTLSGDVDFGDTAPFLGFGWDGAFNSDSRLGFKALVGAAFGDDPQANLSRTGGVALTPVLQAQLDAALAQEEREVEEEVDFSVYPVVQLGFSYRF